MTVALAIVSACFALLVLRARRDVAAAELRSTQRRLALRRVAEHCRAEREAFDEAVEIGMVLVDRCVRRDAAIDALTRRVAELLPCHDRIAFVDGELAPARAAAFRAHLPHCLACSQALPEDVGLAARLSTLEGAP